MTWQRALKLLAEDMTQKEIAALLGDVSWHAVNVWFGFIHGHAWGYQPTAFHKAKLIHLATERILSGPTRTRRRRPLAARTDG